MVRSVHEQANTTYVALLRGVNVGGRNRLAMADLRALLAGLGHGAPRTYVQSGNAIFASDRSDGQAMADELAGAIATELGVSPSVMLRSADQLAAVVAANPFAPEAAADPTTVHAAFLSAEPDDPAAFAVDPAAFAPEQIAVGDRVRYLHLPAGIGRSPLATELARRRAGVAVTIRNWRTVTALLDMVAG